MSRSMVVLVGLLLVAMVAVPISAQVNLVHMVYGSHGAAWEAYLKEMAVEFNKIHPNITVEILPGGGSWAYMDKVLSMLAGGIGPDITDGSEVIAASIVDQGAYLNLRPYIDKDGIDQDFVPVAWQSVTTPDGTVIGMPMDLYPIVGFYNADILAESGLVTPNERNEDEWTWEQLLEMAKKTTRLDGNGRALQYGLDRTQNRWWNYIVQAGGQPYDRPMMASESHWNTPEVVEGIDWLRALLHEHKVAPPPGTPGISDYYFQTGRAAFNYAYGPGFIGAYLTNADFKWDIALQAKGPDNRGAQVAVNSVQVLSSSKHPEESWEWVKFITHHADSVRRYVQLTARVPAITSIQAEVPELMGDLVPTHWQHFYQTAMDPRSFPSYVLAKQREVNTIVNAQLNPVWRGDQATEVAVQQIHEQLTQLLAE